METRILLVVSVYFPENIKKKKKKKTFEPSIFLKFAVDLYRV